VPLHLWFRGEGHALAGERGGWESPSSDDGTFTVVLCKYTYFVTTPFTRCTALLISSVVRIPYVVKRCAGETLCPTAGQLIDKVCLTLLSSFLFALPVNTYSEFLHLHQRDAPPNKRYKAKQRLYVLRRVPKYQFLDLYGY
jgi:hypothetical protein